MPFAYDTRDAYGRLRPAASQSGRPARHLGSWHYLLCHQRCAARHYSFGLTDSRHVS